MHMLECFTPLDICIRFPKRKTSQPEPSWSACSLMHINLQQIPLGFTVGFYKHRSVLYGKKMFVILKNSC